MTRYLSLISAVVLFLGGCAQQAPPVPLVESQARPISYLDEVKPVFDTRCAVCHSCYNSPCQLKLTSFEGVDRGGSKDPVYSGSRLSPQQPTRLFIDAQSTDEWREMGFHGVTGSPDDSHENQSIMRYFLDAKRRNPVPDISLSLRKMEWSDSGTEF